MIKKIYSDCDGVLTDVATSYREQFGIDCPDSNEEFYKYTRKTKKNFWSHLGWMKDGQKYWSFLKKYCKIHNIKLFILTAPPTGDLDPTFKKGRKEWIAKNLGGEWLDKTIIDRQKWLWAEPSALLIDDMQHNIDSFKEMGGKTITYTDFNSFLEKFHKIVE